MDVPDLGIVGGGGLGGGGGETLLQATAYK